MIFYLSQWFPAHMRARAISRFYISFPISSVLMGAIAGVLLDLQGKAGLAGWQWLFLVEGLPAVVLSMVFLFFLPASPATAKWLTEEERGWILLHNNQPSAVDHNMKLGRALLDVRVWQISKFSSACSAPVTLTLFPRRQFCRGLHILGIAISDFSWRR